MLSRFEQFSYMISGIYRCIQNIERDEMIKYGYKGSYAIYLATLRRYQDGLTSAELGEICVKDKAAVSRIVSEMEQKNLITRRGDNLYRAKLKLTSEGEQIADFVCNKAQSAVNAVSSKMSEGDRKILYSTLDMIYSGLSRLSENGIPEDIKEK